MIDNLRSDLTVNLLALSQQPRLVAGIVPLVEGMRETLVQQLHHAVPAQVAFEQAQRLAVVERLAEHLEAQRARESCVL